jgi:pheromone a factor receptor
MADVPFTVFTFFGFLLAIECLYFISKTPGRPWATYILMIWVLLVNLVSFTDSVIWRGPDPAEWWDGKVYCDISSRIKTEFPIGVCGAAIGISRFLAEATDPDPKHNDMKYNRMKRNIIDIVLGVVLPIINAALRILVEPARYYIMGVNGCSSITRTAWPAIPIYFLWVPLMTLVAAVYACTSPSYLY